MEFSLHGDGRRDVAVNEMINEVLSFAVFPFLRMDRQGLRAERITVRLTQRGKTDFRKGVESGCR